MNDKKTQKLDRPLHEYDKFVSPKTGKEIDIKKTVEKVDFVRGCVHAHNPCFGALLDNLNFIYTFNVPTQATDGTRLFINPEWTSTLTDGEIRFVMIHELMHSVFNHMKRGIGHKKMLSNIAADFEVNGAAMLDKFATQGQVDKMGTYYSDKYVSGSSDLWAYEAIYEDLLKNGFVPNAPYLDIVWPNNSSNGTEPKRASTSKAWKAGHAKSVHDINEVLNSEYSKISKKPTEKYTVDELQRALENTVVLVTTMLTMSSDTKYPEEDYEEENLYKINKKYHTFKQGYEYGLEESLSEINSLLMVIGMQDLFKEQMNQIKDKLDKGELPDKEDFPKIDTEMKFEVPAIDPAEEKLNLPHPPSYGGGLNEPLSKEDIISQQEGANIARESGYKGDFTKEEELDDVENKWAEAISHVAGKEGSQLITRHIFDHKASDYNWQYELRKLMNRSIKNSVDYNNEWGEKRGLARDTMTLKHKNNHNGMKDIVFLVDCSGSVSDDMLSDILSECYSISKKCNVKDITYAYFTTKVELVETNCMKMKSQLKDIAVMQLKNGPARGGHITGGTDFKNALGFVNDIGGAKCAIIITDGYDTPIPKPSKIKNLIWCVYDNKNFTSVDNSHVVHLDTSKMKNNKK